MGETVHIGEEREALGNAVLVVPVPIVLGLIGLGELPRSSLVIELETMPEFDNTFSSKSVPKETKLLAPLVPGTAPSGAGRPGLDRHSWSSRCCATSGCVLGSRFLFWVVASVVSVMPDELA